MDGVVIIDKPAGITSAEVVRRIKRVVKPSRVGHLGTLDPFATGVLPILVGEGTKLAPFLEGGDKHYSGVIKLGIETDTLDRDGEPVRTAEVPSPTADTLAAIENQFIGTITQVPPVFSALKRDGVPLYKLARKGVAVEPPEPRQIVIRSLKLQTASPDSLRLEVECSTGTYIRSLARDIGVALGTVAHLAELRRLRSGGFAIGDAQSLATMVEAMESGGTPPVQVLGLADAIPHLQSVVVDSTAEGRLRNGDSSALDLTAPSQGGTFKVLNSAGNLIAIARATSRATAVIERIFNV
jgi:tRNA pseudouridine55 synthase